MTGRVTHLRAGDLANPAVTHSIYSRAETTCGEHVGATADGWLHGLGVEPVTCAACVRVRIEERANSEARIIAAATEVLS